MADPLELALALGDVGGVVVGVPPGLSLGLAPVLGRAPPLGLALPLPDGLGLGLVVLPLLAPPLGDVAGALVVLGGELFLVCVTDGLVDADGQALGERDAPAAGWVDGAPPGAADGAVEVVPLPSTVPAALEELLLMLRAEPMASPTWNIAWRAGGTTDRTKPTANTAVPTAKAGRSMASRQSRGRRGPGRCASLGRAGWPSCRISLASAAQMAIQMPRIPLGWLACAGRDRILSRIRSRPSAPGST